jgi:hypothetical protein
MRFELIETALMLVGMATIFYALALIIRGMFISWRLRKQARHMATFTKAGLTKREEYDEVSRRG